MITAARVAAFFRPRVIFAKLAAVILWVCYAGSIVLGDGYATFNLKGELLCADHLAFYTAARLIREGQPEKVYDYEFVTKYQNELIPMGRWTSLEAFRNPPFYALLYYPTAGWPYQASAWFWAGVSLAALAAGVWLLVGRFPSSSPPLSGEGPGEGLRGEEPNPPTPFPKREGGAKPTTPPGYPPYPRALFWVASFYPAFCALSYGQNTLLSFLVFAVVYRLLAANRPFAAGLVAGLLWFKPPLLLGLGLWGLLDIRRKWPCAAGVVVTGAVLTLGTYPVVPAAWEGFAGTLNRNAGFENFEQFKMHNPLAFWRLLLPDWEWPALKPLHAPLAAACSLAAVAVFVWLWRRQRDDLPVMFGAAVFVTLLASPHALIYEWALLGITAVLWWPETRRDPDRWFLVYGVVWVVMFASTVLAELQYHHLPAAVQISVPVLGWAFWWSARQLRRPVDGLADASPVVGMGGAPPRPPAADPGSAP